MFQKNDYVIYGSNGVCKIQDIGPLDMPGIPKERIYYTLVPYYTKDSQIFTPVDSNKVAKGTLTLSTPNKKATIGANNTRIIKSLIAT